MPKERMIEKEVGSYISTLLRDYFGKGPSSVYVTANPPYITIQLRGFLAPTEKFLLRQKEIRRILETRDLLMKDLKEQIAGELSGIGEFSVGDMYTDWNLEEQTGLILAVLENGMDGTESGWPKPIDDAGFRETISRFSEKAQKIPEKVEAFWLNNRTLLVKRSGIFIHIEKELIEAGFDDELKLVKRPMERRMLMEINWRPVIGRSVQEVYMDWNILEDYGYIILILDPEEK
ncbi:DUF2294 domain-containing protein [Planococcus chinensis]|uniref:DUF2294 domain-containing protein n=1 Tax=Planococcus chinensis TaxID=272917 RepID=A0ABW4QDK6_9BACL